jgi:hypothetical protein
LAADLENLSFLKVVLPAEKPERYAVSSRLRVVAVLLTALVAQATPPDRDPVAGSHG